MSEQEARERFIAAARRAFETGFDSAQEEAAEAEAEWVAAIRASERVAARELEKALKLMVDSEWGWFENDDGSVIPRNASEVYERHEAALRAVERAAVAAAARTQDVPHG